MRILNTLNITNIEYTIHWGILKIFRFAKKYDIWKYIFLTKFKGCKAWILFPNEDITNEHNGSVFDFSKWIKHNMKKTSPRHDFYRQSPCLFTRIYGVRCHATVRIAWVGTTRGGVIAHAAIYYKLFRC